MIDKQLLADCAKEYDIELNEPQLKYLDEYASLLIEWNEKINLTAIVEPLEIAIKHFLDSLLLLKAVKMPQKAKLIDVGCGAGFPSLPCKIVRTDINLTLLDSVNKRLNFLREVVATMPLNNVEFLHGRAEEVGKNKQYREKYDVATARAVANLRELSEYCLPLVKVGGVFAALKGYNIEEELEQSKEAIELLGGKVEEVIKFNLPMDNSRSIIIIKKISQTPQIYPRIPAKIAKFPL
ncbi:MAG: 16S rRNA (guanine(527)-N(7))-methyltransferase RsmG [Oscillospiraceae bacterium]